LPRPRFDKLDADKQHQILEVAAVEFGRAGYEGAALSAIIEAAGISKGALYYYFDDKADLFASTLEYVDVLIARARPAMLEGATAATFWQLLGEYIEGAAEVIGAYPWVVGLGRAYHHLPPEVREAARVKAYLAKKEAEVGELIAFGRSLGVIRGDLPDELLRRLTMAAGEVLDRWILERVVDPAELSSASRVSMTVMRGLLEAPGAR
jgi:AcrR family transcriptional regulator